jgi:orotidine-5'-phosphate decarboxylase
VLDGKRNDIEHTATAYARAWLAPRRPVTGESNPWRVDAMTINGYLGADGIKPFLDADPDAGLFVLAKTSNESSGEFQDLILKDHDHSNFQRMAQLSEEWGKGTAGKSGFSRVGLVVGATFPEVATQLRAVAPSALFLMPGIGAQGAEFHAVALGCRPDGFGAYASASRSVLYSFDAEAAAEEDAWRAVVAEAAEREAKCIKARVLEALGGK